MIKEFDLYSLSENAKSTVSVELPSQCPQCSTSLLPQILYGIILNENVDDSSVYLLNLCPQCEKCFLSFHMYNSSEDCYFHIASYPYVPPTTNWGRIINDVSPTFVEIYHQAEIAENQNLDQIAGVGYRKSLEFLIKDYLISQTEDPIRISEIKTKFLGKCINEDIDNSQLKTVASRAAWLGNDQTHYEQRFNDRDISDLKRMIRLSVHWISLIKETEEAENITHH